MFECKTDKRNSQCEHGQPMEQKRGLFCTWESGVARCRPVTSGEWIRRSKRFARTGESGSRQSNLCHSWGNERLHISSCSLKDCSKFFCHEELFLSSRTVQNLVKCRILTHFIWVFNVCQSTWSVRIRIVKCYAIKFIAPANQWRYKITKLMNALQLQDIMIQQLLHIHVTWLNFFQSALLKNEKKLYTDKKSKTMIYQI